MNGEYKAGLNALSQHDPRWSTALDATGIISKQDRQAAACSGLGNAIEQRRAAKASNRKRVKAARKSSKANR